MTLSKESTSVLGFCAIITLINCLRKLQPQNRFLTTYFSSILNTIKPTAAVESADRKDKAAAIRVIRGRLSMEMEMGSFYIAKQNSDRPFGEDAHFISEDCQVFGLADGVGGWAKKGIDSGKYARELMENVLLAILLDNPTDIIHPMQILNKAFYKTKSEGSSTACIVALNNDLLQAVNVGDGGFALFRQGKIMYKNRPQQHYFNKPHHIGLTSKQTADLKVADNIAFKVELGDVLVAGTDGLFDNVYLLEIEKLVEKSRREADSPKEMACKIANVALSQSLNRVKVSPFAKAASRAGSDYSMFTQGGKIDDITVIVAYVVQPLDSV